MLFDNWLYNHRQIASYAFFSSFTWQLGFSGYNNFTFSFVFHLGYYKTHSDADSEGLSPALKLPPRLHCTSLELLYHQGPVKGSAQSRRVASFTWCPRILPGPKLCVQKSKSVEHEVGWWSHIREIHFNRNTHTSLNWGTEKRSSIACYNSFLSVDASQTWYEQMNIIHAMEPWSLILTRNNSKATVWKMDIIEMKR